MGYKVLRSAACETDLEIIFDYLLQTYQDLGEPLAVAFSHAEDRILRIEAALDALGEVPFQGTLEENILPGLRHVTKDRAILYFVTDEAAEEVRILAVFFGGQDHHRHVLDRIRSGAM